MIANKDSSVSVFVGDDTASKNSNLKNNFHVNLKFNINVPEKIVFDGKHTTTYSSGNKKIELARVCKFMETKETKKIEGYACVKYEVIDDNDNISYAWICKELPFTITPAGGIRNAPGAILQYENPIKNLKSVVEKLKKSVTNKPTSPTPHPR